MMAKGRAGHLFGFVMDGVFGCSLALVILQVVSGQSSFGSSGPSFFGAEESTVVQVEQSSSPLPSSTLLSVVQSFVPPSTLLVQRFVTSIAVHTTPSIIYVCGKYRLGTSSLVLRPPCPPGNLTESVFAKNKIVQRAVATHVVGMPPAETVCNRFRIT